MKLPLRCYSIRKAILLEPARPKAGEIESQSADIQRWSGIMATTRHAYWQQARNVLTAPQRQRADALLAKVTVVDLH